MNTVGMLFTHGSIAVLEDNSSTAAQTFQTWHTFGDPTMQVRTRAPEAIRARINEELALDALDRPFRLSVGEPGITISFTDGARLLAAATSDPHGEASFPGGIDLSAASGREATVTLTGFNKFPLVTMVRW